VKKVENVEINPYSFYEDRWGDVVLDKFCLNVPNFDSGIGTAYFDDVLIVEISSAAKSSDIDTGGDNVPDDQDTCYNPGCSIVDSQGCPKDSDSDGVNDCDDGCPLEYGTADNGCPVTPLGVSEFLFFYVFLVLIAVITVLAVLKKRKRGMYDDTQMYDDDTRIY